MTADAALPYSRGLDVSELAKILCCPLCKGCLNLNSTWLSCQQCGKQYPIILGIPDLRVYPDPLIPLDDDYQKGAMVQARAETLHFDNLVRYYWSLPTYPPTPDDLKERFIHHVLTDEVRIQSYEDQIGHGGKFLDVGCGTAALLKVAYRKFDLAIGCDVAFRWLLIARKRLQEAGLPVNLICCCADYLPFPPGLFDSVASVSLLEHVASADAVIRESGRVLGDKGRLFIRTTNRFSFAPEPHVRVWGVGFLPRRWMPVYVRWVRGMKYEKKCLLSFFEIRRLLAGAGFEHTALTLPVVTEADWNGLNGLERLGARLFRWGARIPLLRQLLLIFSPVIQLVARRRDARKRSAFSPGEAKRGFAQ